MVDFIAQEGGGGMFNMMIAMLFAMIAMTWLSGRKEKKQRLAWMSGLKKNDRIITKAGIYGTITSMKDDSVVIKIDDDKGTKMTITKESVSHSVPDKKEEVKK